MDSWETLLGIFMVLFQQGFSLCTHSLCEDCCVSCTSAVRSFPAQPNLCILHAKAKVETNKIREQLHKSWSLSHRMFSLLWGHALCQPVVPQVALTHVLTHPCLPLALGLEHLLPQCPGSPTHAQGFRAAVTHVGIYKYTLANSCYWVFTPTYFV